MRVDVVYIILAAKVSHLPFNESFYIFPLVVYQWEEFRILFIISYLILQQNEYLHQSKAKFV